MPASWQIEVISTVLLADISDTKNSRHASQGSHDLSSLLIYNPKVCKSNKIHSWIHPCCHLEGGQTRNIFKLTWGWNYSKLHQSLSSFCYLTTLYGKHEKSQFYLKMKEGVTSINSCCADLIHGLKCTNIEVWSSINVCSVDNFSRCWTQSSQYNLNSITD